MPTTDTAERLLWTITKDCLLLDGESFVGDGNYFGDSPEEDLPYRFQLFDDDEEIHFEGRANTFNLPESEAFMPLDWAMAETGATQLRFKKKGDESWTLL